MRKELLYVFPYYGRDFVGNIVHALQEFNQLPNIKTGFIRQAFYVLISGQKAAIVDNAHIEG